MALTVNEMYANLKGRKFCADIAKNIDKICGKKIKYETIEAANECIKELIEKRKTPSGIKEMRVYKCPNCSFFHVGAKK